MNKNRKWIRLVIPILAAALLLTGCAIVRSGGGAEDGGWTTPDEDWSQGMIEVDDGGTQRWIRDYENVPLNPLQPSQFDYGDRFLRYLGDEFTALQGIDVSTFQGEIDWSAVAADGVGFAMIRIGGRGYGSGSIYEDDRFLTNAQGALDNGVRVGAYFFSQAVDPAEAEEEAEVVLEYLSALPEGSVTMPVAFDWEMVSGDETRTGSMDSQTLTACAVAFCRRIAEAGYTPAVYAYPYLAYEMYDLSQLTEWPLWISTLNENPDFRYAFSMWQYSESGYVDGIEGSVDLDLWFEPAALVTEEPEEPEETEEYEEYEETEEEP